MTNQVDERRDLLPHREIPRRAICRGGEILLDHGDAIREIRRDVGRGRESRGLIDPRDSRRVLAMALHTCTEAQRRSVQTNAFGVARP